MSIWLSVRTRESITSSPSLSIPLYISSPHHIPSPSPFACITPSMTFNHPHLLIHFRKPNETFHFTPVHCPCPREHRGPAGQILGRHARPITTCPRTPVAGHGPARGSRGPYHLNISTSGISPTQWPVLRRWRMTKGVLHLRPSQGRCVGNQAALVLCSC